MNYNENCVFCSVSKDAIIVESKLSFAIFDRFPVTNGHVLVIPKRHVSSYFDLYRNEREDLFDLIEQVKIILDEKFAPDGYNIGINVGESAGQTIMHVHIHLIPRFWGDIDNPRGGVRGVIPEKRIY